MGLGVDVWLYENGASFGKPYHRSWHEGRTWFGNLLALIEFFVFDLTDLVSEYRG